MKRQAVVGWLSVLLLALSALPAWAGPLSQAGTKTYRRPAWVLTMEYPASWSVEELAGDVVGLSSDSSGSTGVNGICLLARSAGYANADYALDELFQDVMNKIDGTADNFASAPADARRIAGIEADAASFTADNSSDTKLQGNIYRVVKGRYGYGIIIASTIESWEQYQSDFDALLDSIQLGATRLGDKTPTRTPRPPAATPTAAPTPEPVGLTSAREAYELAWPEVEQWSQDAVLGEAYCTAASSEGDAAGKCREWDLMFMASMDAEIIDLGYEAVVSGGRLDTARGGEDLLFLSDGLGTDWLDSTEAMQIFLDDGGRRFLARNPQAELSDLSLYASLDGSPMWTVRATAGDETRAEFAREIDAITGEVRTPAPTATATEESAVAPAWNASASHVRLGSCPS